MIKRYKIWYDEIEEGLKAMDVWSTGDRIEEDIEEIAWIKEDDIKDSLIVWHDLRENPDDLPRIMEYIYMRYDDEHYNLDIVGYQDSSGEWWELNVFNDGGDVRADAPVEWAYIKPPLTHTE